MSPAPGRRSSRPHPARASTRSSPRCSSPGSRSPTLRNGVVKPRIRLLGALARLLPERPFLEAVTPSQGGLGQQLTVTVTGLNFGSGTSVSFGAGVTVEQTSTVSATELTATVAIAADATLGARDVTVVNASGESTTLSGAFLVTPAPPSLSLGYEGKLRDRVGKGNGLTAPDGALDATFKVTVEAGSGARTVTQLELWTLNGSGRWDTIPTTTQWMVGAAARARQPAPQRQQRHRQLRHQRRPKLLPLRPRPSPQALHPRRPSPSPRPPRRRLQHDRRHDPQRGADVERCQPAAGGARSDAERDRDREQLPERRNRQLRRRHERHRDQRRLPDKPDGHRRDRRQRDTSVRATSPSSTPTESAPHSQPASRSQHRRRRRCRCATRASCATGSGRATG